MNSAKPIYLQFLIISLLILGFTILGNHSSSRTRAGNLSKVSVTMDNSRISFRGKVAADPGSGTVITIGVDDTINNGYLNPPTTKVSDPLKIGDTLNFATSGVRTINEIIDGTTIILNNSVSNGELFYLAEKSDLKVVFTTRTYLSGGSFQVLVPAHGTEADSKDGKPDQNFFDFDTTWTGGGGQPSITCTGAKNNAGHNFSSATYTATPWVSVANYSGRWHVYECNYGSGDNNEEITIDISNVINPAPMYLAGPPEQKHVTGTADTYNVIIRHLSSTGTEIDATTAKIGVIEAVRVSATVAPSLTFTITGVPLGTTACGQSTTVATYASEVPLGELSTGMFTHAAQNLKITTNAKHGAVVTAIANDQLGLNGGACVGDTYNSTLECIWDANVSGMTHQDTTTGSPGEKNWASTAEAGFGFSLENGTHANPDFYYNQGSPAGTFVARHFADAEATQDPQKLFDTIVSGVTTGPTNDSNLYVCYRALADNLTVAGDYFNYITYTATATF